MRFWQLSKRLATHLAVGIFFAAPFALVGAQGCTLADDYCAVFCECEQCNDRAADECDIAVVAAFDRAAAYDCSDEADKFYECAIDKNDCSDTDFSIDDGCNDEQQDYFDCVDDNSDIIAGSQQQAQAPATGGGAIICACACVCDMCEVPDASRTCNAGEGGCDSCDTVCSDACLAVPNCGAAQTNTGTCAPVP